MVREELVTGLKNALARGQSLEKAINSLLSSGYNPDEVRDAASYANVGVTGNMGVVNSFPKNEVEQTQEAQFQQVKLVQKLNDSTAEPKKSKVGLMILISLLVLLVIGIFGIVLFGDQILQTLFPK